MVLYVAVELDQDMIQQLQSMGFAEEGCKRAVYNNPTGWLVSTNTLPHLNPSP
jgi:uncharacterized UBP type Zn finger protein